jgi:hypothetical protein
MSSLFEKLKTLVTARVLGPAPRRSDPAAPDEGEAESGPVPEVTDASAHRPHVPEVTEASPAEMAAFEEPVPVQETGSPSSQKERVSKGSKGIDDSQIESSEPDSLEDARVADLLKGKES